MRRLIWLPLGLLLLIVAAPSQAQTGTPSDVLITLDDPTYNRPLDNCGNPAVFAVHYQTQDFYVTETGEYDMRFSQSGIPTAVAIYDGFDPANPSANCIDSSAPANPLVKARIIATFEKDKVYTMVKSCRLAEMPCYWFYETHFGPGGVVAIEPDDDDPPDDNPPDDDDEPVDEVPKEDDEPLFDDDRIEQPFIDKVAIYNRLDENGNPALHIYCINEQSEGVLWGVVTQENYDAAKQSGQESLEERGWARVGINVISDYLRPNDNPGCVVNIQVAYYHPGQLPDGPEIKITDVAQGKQHYLYLNGVPATAVADFYTAE